MVFTKRVFKNYKEIWAVSSSSRFLYKKMIYPICFSKDIHIVEFWPWDWFFSDKLLKDISPNSKISIFEIDAWFCKLLKEKYKNESRITVYETSAASIKDFFKKDSIDYIISSLPLAFIPQNIVWEILEKSKYILKPEWKFIQYQYFLQNKKQMKHYFPHIDYKFTFLNFPPAFVYICHK